MTSTATLARPPTATTSPRTPGGVGDRTACALATGVAEQIVAVLAGRRTLDQIRVRVSGPVAGLITTTRGRNPLGGPSYRLRSVHACVTTPSKVEACAVIGTANRVRSLVLRLEQENTTWSCTMLALL
jgi:hypothetical protein